MATTFEQVIHFRGGVIESDFWILFLLGQAKLINQMDLQRHKLPQDTDEGDIAKNGSQKIAAESY